MTGRILPIVALAVLSAGCQGGPISGHQSMVGQLKASVSQLEFQNDELQRQVAGLKSENRRFEDQIVAERAENQDLATRLDNAKGLLGSNPTDLRTGSRTRSDDDSSVDSVAPKARRPRRKPPAASIPWQIEPSKDSSDDLGLVDPLPKSRLASRRTLDDRWLPVARGVGSGQGTVK